MSFTVYKSSAGSGKTYTLVKEYLGIVLQDPDSFSNILAVTFTNKAAGEMKHRVLSCLEELSGEEAGKGHATKNLLPSLVTDTGLNETVIRIRAGEALKKILHRYSDFSIGTIDSFSHRVIRAFAHDFGLSLNFKVELDADELIETAVDLLLDKAGDDEQLTSLLVNFLESNLDDDKSWAIDKALMEFSTLLLDEDSQQQLLKLRNLSLDDFSHIAGILRKKIRTFERSLQEEATASWNAISEAGIEHQSFAYGRSGLSWYFEQLSLGRFDKPCPSPRLVAAVGKDNWSSGKASSADKEKIESIKPVLHDSFHKLLHLLEKSYADYCLFKILMKSVYPLAVLNSIDRLLQDFKKQNNIIHISEFNSRIAKVVLGEPVPFIYERIGEKYRHILIDEFQDTSALQWQNFVPLIENSLASGYFNLVVGDGKQAIYRWRNGDVEQFTSLPSLQGSSDNWIIRERQEALERNFNEKLLNRNFRSGKEIVEFNNDFFGYVSGFLDTARKKVYDGHVQLAHPLKEGGYISISFTAKTGDGETTADVMLKKTLEVISSCRRDGYRPKDIAILCRSNREASLVAQMLIENEIPVVSGESLLLNYSPLVRMLTGLVRYIFGPVNPVIQAETLNHYSRLFPSLKPFFRSWLGCGQSQRTALFNTFLNERIGGDGTNLIKTLPVYDLFIRLINGLCPASAGDAYVQFFLNTVLKFSSDHSSSAKDFLDWWDDHHEKLSLVMPSGIDAVKLMTIHKAKGLQFPVVIYPFAGDSLKNTRKYIWIGLDHSDIQGLPVALMTSGKDMEETVFAGKYLEERQKSMLDMLNLLYVVMTRPEERLYLLPPLPPIKTDEPASVPSLLKAWLQHKEIWADDRFDYDFGCPIAANQAVSSEISVMPMPGVSFGEWRDKIRIRSSAPEIWNPDDPDKNRRFGNVLHTILAGITKDNEASVIITAMIENGLLDRAREDEVRNKIRKIIADPALAFIFNEKDDLRLEAEILTRGGHTVRPDRVILKGSRAVIVDYKTGRPMEKYRNQLSDYARNLEDMGYKEVKKYLLYLEPEIKLEEVE
ncbi:MAG: UvrD-helicase domain-containing protein [Bacteroidetes bacterium]|nr:UvrD-helicase domain-containing protein [Bacteroidota bacterium]